MAIYQKYTHDVDDKLDYGLDWKPFLESTERVVECTWSVHPYGELTPGDTDPSPLETYSPSISSDGKKTKTYVRSGSAGRKYLLTGHIKTNSTPEARETDQSILLVVADK